MPSIYCKYKIFLQNSQKKIIKKKFYNFILFSWNFLKFFFRENEKTAIDFVDFAESQGQHYLVIVSFNKISKKNSKKNIGIWSIGPSFIIGSFSFISRS